MALRSARPWHPSLLVALALLPWTGCGDDQDPAAARDLWDRIHADDYRGWRRAPGWPERAPSSSPHGDEVDVFVDAVVAAALDADEPLDAWPAGSRVVKDGWDGGDLDVVAAMEKRADGWFWAEWDPDGSSIYSGRPDTCTDCHRRGDDYVRAFPLP